MMLSPLVMIILATTLYNQANSAGVPPPPPTLFAHQEVLKAGQDIIPKNEESSSSLEHKIGSLIESISRMENSIQNLQEKSHTWAIFQHHIESWNDGLRILDNKLDILKRSHEEQRGQLNNLELTLSNANDSPVIEEIRDTLKRDRGIQMESSSKVNMILRQLQTMQKEKNLTSSAHGRKKANIVVAEQQTLSSSCNGTNKIEQRLSTIAHQMVHQKDLKQLHAVEKRIAKNLEGLTQSLTQALDQQEEITTRLQKSNECCYSLSSEITTFTESSDILLKRIERLINNVNDKLNKIEQNHEEEREEDNHKENTDDDDGEEEEEEHTGGLHSDVFNDEIDSNESKEGTTDIEMENEGEDNVTEESETESHEPDVEFLRPDLAGCHELPTEEDDEDEESMRIDGIYKFRTPDINELERDFNERHCVFPTGNNSTNMLPWTVIQQRVPYTQQENFNRSWADYRNGFGNLYRDFWFGNEFIHRLVYHEDYELRVELEDFDGTKAWAEYGIFRLDTESFNYNLLIDDYRSESTAGDALAYHNDNDFSTYDRRNDKTIDACCPCSLGYGSGWWFDNCSEANLNGLYRFTPLGHNYNGIMWELWHGDYSLKRTRMMIRPRNYPNDNTVVDSSYDEEGERHEDP